MKKLLKLKTLLLLFLSFSMMSVAQEVGETFADAQSPFFRYTVTSKSPNEVKAAFRADWKEVHSGETVVELPQKVKRSQSGEEFTVVQYDGWCNAPIKEIKFPNGLKTLTLFSSDIERIVVPNTVTWIGGLAVESSVLKVVKFESGGTVPLSYNLADNSGVVLLDTLEITKRLSANSFQSLPLCNEVKFNSDGAGSYHLENNILYENSTKQHVLKVFTSGNGKVVTIPKTVTKMHACCLRNNVLDTLYFEPGRTEELVSTINNNLFGNVTQIGFRIKAIELPCKMNSIANARGYLYYYNTNELVDVNAYRQNISASHFVRESAGCDLVKKNNVIILNDTMIAINNADSLVAASKLGGDTIDKIVIPKEVKYMFGTAFSKSIKKFEFELGGTESLAIQMGAVFLRVLEQDTLVLPCRIDTNSMRYTPAAKIYLLESGCNAYSAQDDILYNADRSIIYRNMNKSRDSVNIPASVIQIKQQAFHYSRQLQTITFEANSKLKEIHNAAFYGCSSLESIDLKANTPNLTVIDMHSFRYCGNLKNVTLPDGLERIGEAAFDGTSLQRIVIPKKTIFTDNTFGSIHLKYVEFQVPRVRDSLIYSLTIYENTPFKSQGRAQTITVDTLINIPKGMKEGDLHKLPFAKHFTFESGAPYTVHEGCVYNSDATEFLWKLNPDSLNINLLSTTKKIAPKAFYIGRKDRVGIYPRLKDLRVTFNDGLEEIGENALVHSKGRMDLPKTLKRICSNGIDVNDTNTKEIYVYSDALTMESHAISNSATTTRNTILYMKGSGVPTTISNPFNYSVNSMYVPCASFKRYQISPFSSYIGIANILVDPESTSDPFLFSNIDKDTVIYVHSGCLPSASGNSISLSNRGSVTFDIFDASLAGEVTVDERESVEFLLKRTNQTHFNRSLKVGSWNLVGHICGSGNHWEKWLMKDYNSPEFTGVMDWAASPFNFNNNNWAGSDPRNNDTLPIGQDKFDVFCKDYWRFSSVMLYPYPNENTGVAIGDSVNLWTWRSNTSAYEFKAETQFTLENYGDETTTSGSIRGRWFPLHNPYLGRLSVGEFLADNRDALQGQYVYIYVNDGWKYLDKDTDTILRPSAGFVVAGLEDEPRLDITFKRTQIYTGTTSKPSFKSDNQDNHITFTTNANNTTRDAIARMNTTAQNGFDGNDAYVMLSTNKIDLVEPYFLVDNHMIFDNHFQSLPYEAPINFHASKQSQVEFTMNNSYDNIEVSIVDVNTNEETILENGEVFNFVAEEGENEGRYKIRFNKKSVGIEEVENTVDVRFEQNAGAIEIFGNDLQNVEVINTLGQTIYNQKVGGNQTKVENLNTGAYIIKVKTSNGTATEKIIVK